MSEKIHFQRFIRQHPLQLGDLPTQDQLSGSRMGKVYFFESIAPVVKQSSRYPKLSRKPEYVVAGLHPLESLASKFVTVSLPFLSLHFAAPFSQSVHHKLSHPRGSLQSRTGLRQVPQNWRSFTFGVPTSTNLRTHGVRSLVVLHVIYSP
jgi:hypothetical protein